MNRHVTLVRLAYVLLPVMMAALSVAGAAAQPLYEPFRPDGIAGIGAMVNADEAGGVIVAAVMPDGPAERAGVEPGDRIIAVDGVAIEGMELADIVRRIRGREGNPVTLTLRREGYDEPMSLQVVRERIGFGPDLDRDRPPFFDRPGPNDREAPWQPFFDRTPEARPWERPFERAEVTPPAVRVQQPVMVIEGGKIYILLDGVLYKFDAETLDQLGSAFVVPPRPDGG